MAGLLKSLAQFQWRCFQWNSEERFRYLLKTMRKRKNIIKINTLRYFVSLEIFS
jgi:hypothetical protein